MLQCIALRQLPLTQALLMPSLSGLAEFDKSKKLKVIASNGKLHEVSFPTTFRSDIYEQLHRLWWPKCRPSVLFFDVFYTPEIYFII